MDYDKIDDEEQWFHGLTFLTILYRSSGLIFVCFTSLLSAKYIIMSSLLRKTCCRKVVF